MSRYTFVALALATLAFTLCFAVWGLVSPLAPQFREAYRLSATETGLLVAVPVLLGSLFRIPMGILTDRYGGRVVFSALMLFLVVPVASIGFANSYASLLFWGFWLGLAGSSFAVGIPFVARWFPAARQGLALGVYGMGNIGTAIANFAGPRLSFSYGWPWAFWAFLPALAIMAALFWAFGREAPGAGAPARSLFDRLIVLRRHPLAWTFSFFYFITFGGFVAMSIYLPTYLVDMFGLDRADAGARAAGFVVVATIARPVGGYLSDRWGASKILNAVFLGVALLAGALAANAEMVVNTIAFLGAAFALGLGNGAVFKLVPEFFPRETGAVTGLVGAAGGIGGFFPPLVMGFFRDTLGFYAPGFALLSLFSLGGLAANWLIVRKKEQ